MRLVVLFSCFAFHGGGRLGLSYRATVVFSGVVVSGAGAGSVSVVSCSVGAVVKGSGVVVALSVGVLLGVVGVVGVVGAVGSADGSAVTPLFGSWVLFCCEPVAVITSPL